MNTNYNNRYNKYNKIDPEQLAILADNPDPFDTKKENKKQKKYKKEKKKKRKLNRNIEQNGHRKKKRKMSGIPSIRSNSSSDLEILNESFIPFPNEKDRVKVHGDDRYLSRRSKSRSPSRMSSENVIFQVSLKMTETQDKLALKINNNKSYKSYKSYSSLMNIPDPNLNKKTYGRNTGGKHRKKEKRLKRLKNHKKQFLCLRTSTLDDIPITFNHNSMAKDGEILITGLDKKNYENLIKERKKKQTQQIAQHLNPNLAQFVEETNKMRLEKKKKNYIEIDLTMDDIDDDIDDVIILNNDLRRIREKSYNKFNKNITDDSYQFDIFEQEYNANKQYTQKIMKEIMEYQRKKEEDRKYKEEEKQKEKQKEIEKLRKENSSNMLNIHDLKYRKLDEDDENLIDKIFELSTNKIIGHHKRRNIEVRVKDLNTLQDGQWLNDEIINFYMALLQDRNLKRMQENTSSLRVLLMNTFFYTKLTSNTYNYKSVRRWTKKTKLQKKGLPDTICNIFDLDKLIFPVHINNIHWCCGCINFKNKSFEYYDSMSSQSSSSQFFKIIKRYIIDESKDKQICNKLDLTEWNDNNNHLKYPQQQNGVDCGVFTSKCADWITDDLYPDYSQHDMPYFRMRMMIEIIRGKTLDF